MAKLCQLSIMRCVEHIGTTASRRYPSSPPHSSLWANNNSNNIRLQVIHKQYTNCEVFYNAQHTDGETIISQEVVKNKHKYVLLNMNGSVKKVILGIQTLL